MLVKQLLYCSQYLLVALCCTYICTAFLPSSRKQHLNTYADCNTYNHLLLMLHCIGLGILAFGYAQVLHSCTLILFYTLAVAQHLRTPKRVAAASTTNNIAVADSTAAAARADAVSSEQQQQQQALQSSDTIDTTATAAVHISNSSMSSVWLPTAVWSTAATEQVRLRVHCSINLHTL
jgi:hypothetical protein